MRQRVVQPGLAILTAALGTGSASAAPASFVEAIALPWWWYAAPVSAVIALVFAYKFFRGMLAEAPGNERMIEIAGYVRDGAFAYLRQQYKVVFIFLVAVAILLWLMSLQGVQHPLVWVAFVTGGLLSGLAGFFGMNTATHASSRTAAAAQESLNRGLTVAFRSGAVMGLVVVGLALIGITGWFVYLTQIHHHVFDGGPLPLETVTGVMLGAALGASSMALFARVGGGIYTKAADVGADLVGKVEVGIPEDDPRNPAAIADNVGDNVGDVAGMGADLFESYLGSILAAAVLGVAAAATTATGASPLHYVIAPMLLAGIGIILSIVGVYLVRLNNPEATEKDLLPTLHKAVWVTNGLVGVAAFILVWALGLPLGIFGSIVAGLLAGGIIGLGTEYYTAAEYKPTQNIASQAASGAGPVIISGVAEGMLSVWIPNVAIGVGTILAYGLAGGFAADGLMVGLYGVGIAAVGMLSTLGITLATDAYGPIADNAGGNAEMSGLPREVRERTDALDSLGNTTAAIGKGFAIGSAALTALALLASYIEQVRESIHRDVSLEWVAPAGDEPYHIQPVGEGKYGIFFAAPANAGEDVAVQDLTISAFRVTDELGLRMMAPVSDASDAAVGQISLAVNKAGLATQQIVAAEMLREDAGPEPRLLTAHRATVREFMSFYRVELMNPTVLVGVFLGVTLVFVFSALTMKAVSNAASAMVQEVRRQFKEKPGIMDGTEMPDYARCVEISTKRAQREMIGPTALGLAVPVIVGLVFSVAGVMGLLLGGLAAGFSLAVFMANSGGAWDNAKKFIEAGAHGGKGAEAHKAAVVGDTVGDPFKDTSGPSLNILIKLMNVVSIIFAGLVVKYGPKVGELLGLQ
jgi:K(+)-stimulated pyrophosphate-energized sodium pump